MITLLDTAVRSVFESLFAKEDNASLRNDSIAKSHALMVSIKKISEVTFMRDLE